LLESYRTGVVSPPRSPFGELPRLHLLVPFFVLRHISDAILDVQDLAGDPLDLTASRRHRTAFNAGELHPHHIAIPIQYKVIQNVLLGMCVDAW
jgi:hypothetical protein